MAEPFHTLGIAEIQALNKLAIKNFGGVYTDSDGNFHNRASLEHILEATLFPVFDKDLYPTLTGKIAAIIQVIITRHVFHDGNKRAALAVLVALARLNNFMFIPTKDDEDFLVKIAAESLEVCEVENWLISRLRPKPVF